MLALKSTRLSQAGATSIDWGNPIARGLVSVLNAPTVINKVGAFPLSAYTKGISHLGDGSSLAFQNTPAFGSAATIVLLATAFRDASGVTTGSYLGGLGNSSAGNQLFSISTASQLGSVAMRAIIRTTNGGGITTAESASIPTGVSSSVMEVFAAVYDGTTSLKLYRNGADDTAGNLNTAASGSISTLDTNCLGGIRRGTNLYSQTGGQYNELSAVWNRALTKAELVSISANPWQIFR
jgi:hypothetical protein